MINLNNKPILILSAVLVFTAPKTALAEEKVETISPVIEKNADGSRLQERWMRIYENATPEQQEILDQKKDEFHALSPEEQEARLKDYGEQVYDRRENVRDRAENRLDRAEDVRDRREDVRDAKHDGGAYDKIEDVYDRREDVRDRREDVRDRAENRLDRKENRIDRKFSGGERR